MVSEAVLSRESEVFVQQHIQPRDAQVFQRTTSGSPFGLLGSSNPRVEQHGRWWHLGRTSSVSRRYSRTWLPSGVMLCSFTGKARKA